MAIFRARSIRAALARLDSIRPHAILVDPHCLLREESEPATGFWEPKLSDAWRHTHMQVELLSKREQETMLLVADGLSTKEIADKLQISSRTVEVYRNSLRRKLGVRSTAEITRYAIRNGFVR